MGAVSASARKVGSLLKGMAMASMGRSKRSRGVTFIPGFEQRGLPSRRARALAHYTNSLSVFYVSITLSPWLQYMSLPPLARMLDLARPGGAAGLPLRDHVPVLICAADLISLAEGLVMTPEGAVGALSRVPLVTFLVFTLVGALGTVRLPSSPAQGGW